MSYNLLYVDDDAQNIHSTQLLLEEEGYKVDTCTNPLDAISIIEKNEREYAVVLMDYHMPQMNGAEAARQILSRNRNQLIAIYSVDDSPETMRDSWHSGAIDHIAKDSSPEELLEIVARICRKYEETVKTIPRFRISSEKEALIRSVGMVGRSEHLAHVAKDILKFADEPHSVLILGETGTGKELVARALHTMSHRKNENFVAIDCTAIPRDLAESHLFGHKKGAFTGAIDNKQGKFAAAHKGTVFLDEIGDLPLELQAKLLRVLQEKTFEPVGSNTPTKVDIRIIAATHRDLGSLVTEGKFREDLYYRLSELRIHLAPLRERQDDIEPLIDHFTRLYCERTEKHVRFQHRTLPILMNFNWSGNIRQLKSVVESHLIHCSGNAVELTDLNSSLFGLSGTSLSSLAELEKRQALNRKRFIVDHIKSSATLSEAAQKMKISPSRLHYTMQRLGIRV